MPVPVDAASPAIFARPPIRLPLAGGGLVAHVLDLPDGQ